MNTTKLFHFHPGFRLLPGIAFLAIFVAVLLVGHYAGSLLFFLSFLIWGALQYFMLFKCNSCGSRWTIRECPFASTERQLTEPQVAKIRCIKCGTVDFPAQATPAQPI